MRHVAKTLILAALILAAPRAERMGYSGDEFAARRQKLAAAPRGGESPRGGPSLTQERESAMTSHKTISRRRVLRSKRRRGDQGDRRTGRSAGKQGGDV